MVKNDDFSVPLSELINCLSDTIDLVSFQLTDHHNWVGQVAYALACQLGLPEDQQSDIYFAGKVHDIGALSLRDRLKLLRFENSGSSVSHQHAEAGAILLEMFAPLAGLGKLVRYHHWEWANGSGKFHNDTEVPLGSQILHLADRISVLIGTMDGTNLLVRIPGIRSKIGKESGRMFVPALVEAFNDLSCRESFWLGLAFPARSRTFEQREHLRTVILDTEGILELSRMFARIIDFRSHFTATHSSGVAASAAALARLSGKSSKECEQMKIAGLLHDLGKLAVPAELLEKPAALSTEERAVFRCHTYFTRRALENIRSFETITTWGSDHHERIDGKGYPYHVRGDDLSAGSRIMAVADVFTAITEDRPYRAGMDKVSARSVIRDMVSQAALDPDIVDILMKNFEELDCIRTDAQAEAVQEYSLLNKKVATMTAELHQSGAV